jgi:hypothetical protein
MSGPSSRRRFLRRVGTALSVGGLASLSGCLEQSYDGGDSYADTGLFVDADDDSLTREEYADYAASQAKRYGNHGPWHPGDPSLFPEPATFQWANVRPKLLVNQLVISDHVAVVFRERDDPSRYYLYLWSAGQPVDDEDLFGDRPNLRLLQHFVAYGPERGTMTDWQPRPPVASGPVSVSLGGEPLTYPLETGRIEVVTNQFHEGLDPEETHRAKWVGSIEGVQSLHSVAAFDVTAASFTMFVGLTYGGSRRGGPLLG